MRRVRPRFVVISVAIVIMSAAFVCSAQADYVVTLDQVGFNVVATGSGVIDLSGLTFNATGSAPAFITPSLGAIFTGPVPSESADDYMGFTGPTRFGMGNGTLASSGSGNKVGIGSGLLFVPQNYVSNTPLLSSSTWNNVTFSSLGVTPGTYMWTWGNGPNQDFTLQVGAVPEPGTLFLLAFGVFMLIVIKLGKLCRISLMRMFRQVRARI